MGKKLFPSDCHCFHPRGSAAPTLSDLGDTGVQRFPRHALQLNGGGRGRLRHRQPEHLWGALVGGRLRTSAAISFERLDQLLLQFGCAVDLLA